MQQARDHRAVQFFHRRRFAQARAVGIPAGGQVADEDALQQQVSVESGGAGQPLARLANLAAADVAHQAHPQSRAGRSTP